MLDARNEVFQRRVIRRITDQDLVGQGESPAA
jgi:hypothetical protein